MNQTQGRELGPVFKATGEELSPWVRRGLAKLRGRMNATGQSYGHHREELPNGDVVTYTVILNGPVPVYQAVVEPFITVLPEIDPVSDAFMESGWAKVITGTESDFESVIYLTNTQSTMQGGYPTWLDWIGDVDGSIENTRRTYVSGMTSLAMTFDKVVVSPTPQFLVCTVSGKLQMMAQAQYGTQLGVGTLSLEDYLASGGSVKSGA